MNSCYQSKALSKEAVLYITQDGKKVFEFYIKDFVERKAFKSVLREEKNPSVSVFRGSNGYLYHDFATGDTLNAIDFVIAMFDLSFKEALERINSDLNLQLGRSLNNA